MTRRQGSTKEYEYLAFISYQRQDEDVAKKLQHTLEFYKLPIVVLEKKPELKEGIRPIFVDMTELGEEPFLEPAIKKALNGSRFLIVICSPRSAGSKWVNKEVDCFVKLKRTKRIIPFIIDGTPNANNAEEECCTKILKKLLGKRELLGINTSEMGFDAAAVKVVSRMFHVKFSTLWNRYEKEKEEEQRKLKEQSDRLLIAQSRYLSSKSLSLLEQGDTYSARMLALIALITDIQKPCERPITIEAEIALRTAMRYNNAILKSDSTSVITAITFSDDGRFIISASDKNLYVWNLDSGHHEILVGHKAEINTIVCKSNTIISGSADSIIKIWDLISLNCKQTVDCSYESSYNRTKQINSTRNDGQLIPLEPISIPCYLTDCVLGNYSDSVLSVDFNNEYILSGHGDGSVKLWDPHNKNKPILSFEGGIYHKGKVCLTCFNPQNRYIAASVSDDGVFIIWDLRKKRCRYLPTDIAVSSILFSQDGLMLITAHVDNKIRIWDANLLQMMGKPMEGHNGIILSLSLGPDKNSFISASDDNTIRIWDIITHDCVKVIDYLSLSNNPTTITKDDYRYYNQPIRCFVKYNKCNDSIATTINDRSIYLLSLKPDYKYLPILKQRNKCLSISEDGRYILAYNGLIVRINGPKTEEITRIKGALPRTTRFTINEPQNAIATIDSKSNNIHILDVTTGENKYNLVGHKNSINSITFSQDGKKLASTSYDNTIRIWDLFKQSSFSFCDEDVKMVVFNPVLNQIAATDTFGNISTWDYEKKRCLGIVKYKNEITAMVFCNDGSLLLAASENGEIHIVETQLNKDDALRKLNTIEAHNHKIIDLDCSPDNQHFLSATSSHIYIWDLKTLICIQKINNDDTSPHRVCFSKDGDSVISVSLNGCVKIWNFQMLNNLVTHTKTQFAERPLTQEERRLYYLE